MIQEEISVGLPDIFENVLEITVQKDDELYPVVSKMKKEVNSGIIIDLLTKQNVNMEELYTVSYTREKVKNGIKLSIVYDYNPFYGTDYDDDKYFEQILTNDTFTTNVVFLCSKYYSEVDDVGYPFDIYVTEDDQKIPVTTMNQGLKKGDKIPFLTKESEEKEEKVIAYVKRMTESSDDIVSTFFLTYILMLYRLIANEIPQHKIPYLTLYKYALSDEILIEAEVADYSVLTVAATYLECYTKFLESKNKKLIDLLQQELSKIGSKVILKNNKDEEGEEDGNV